MDKHLLRYKGSKGTIFIIGLLTVAQAFTIIFQALFLSDAIVQLYRGTAWSAVLPVFFKFLGVYLLRHLLQWLKARIAYRFAARTSLSMQEKLVRKLFDMGPRSVNKQGTGMVITLALEGVSNFRTYLELFIPRFAAIMVIPAFVFIYVIRTDIASGIVLAIGMPIMIIFLILLGFAAQKQMNAQWGTYQLLSRHFVDSLRGLMTLKYLGRSKSHKSAIETVSDKYRIATNRTLRVSFLSTFSLDFFSSLSVALVAVELGLRLINGHIGLEPALAILILAPEFFLPVRELGNDYHATMDGKEAGENIHRMLSVQTDRADSDIEVGEWNESSKLSVKDMTLNSDEEDRMILRDVHFEAEGFQKIGIVGASGAGKSTIIDILSGFTLPAGGRIAVNGTVIPHLAQSGWQKQISYIPQHPHIFSGTLAENISWYAPEASRQEIKSAAHAAGLSELIEQLPNGLSEQIGQGGRSLSGGEEQRIALARCLLQPRPIMLLDEPTAHLDIETEQELKAAMLPVMKNKLVFFATHRLHWMREMDMIIAVEQGKVAEIGTHDELYSKKGAYYRLVEAQRGGKLA